MSEDKGKVLNREEIFSADDIKMDFVDCPEWGGKVKVKALTIGERTEIMEASKSVQGDMDSTMFEIMALIFGCVSPKFSAADIEPLKKRSFGVIDRISSKIFELSGMSVKPDELKKK